MGLQSLIKYDVKALKPFTLGKMYSMALTFDTKNVELAREKRFLFHVSRRDHSSGKKKGSGRSPKSFHVRREKATLDTATHSATKTKQNTEGKRYATIVMS